MKYTTKQYATALLGALEDKTAREQKKILRRFMQVLLKSRDFSKRAAILKEYERQYLSAHGVKKVNLDSAAPVSPKLKNEIQKILGGKLSVSERVDPTLLAGIKIVVDDETLIDASGRARLEMLLRRKV